MRYWNTSDEVTNQNLAYLDSIAEDRTPPFEPDRLTDKFIGVIEVTKMLPSAVRKHFDVNLYVGDLPYSWSADTRTKKALELCDALSRGLDRVASDPAVQKGGTADLSDRPQSKGEVILAALSAFEERFSTGHFHSELSTLRTAVFGTNLQRHITEIDRRAGLSAMLRPTTPKCGLPLR